MHTIIITFIMIINILLALNMMYFCWKPTKTKSIIIFKLAMHNLLFAHLSVCAYIAVRICHCAGLSVSAFVGVRHCPCAQLSVFAFVLCAFVSLRNCLCAFVVCAIVLCAYVWSPLGQHYIRTTIYKYNII